eukprot:TRINITY_DN12973_c0_g1_i6.p3 TRINITY_DN12973_c0_g1~~TRINITY_DN12973_c0_g1_i6.p3  ORF type:complete len:139 (-),score=18.34 TRINITY_DN12973_c0_g1_i6:48-464(-)
MIIVFKKNGQMQTLLPNGKNKVMKSCVVYSVFNRKITILKQLVFAEFLKQSLKKENSYNVIIADAEDVHLEIETSHKLIFVLAYLYIYLYTLSLSLEKERKNQIKQLSKNILFIIFYFNTSIFVYYSKRNLWNIEVID